MTAIIMTCSQIPILLHPSNSTTITWVWTFTAFYTKCYSVFPTDLPLGSPPPPSALQKIHESTHLLAPQIWSFLSLLPVACKTNSFPSSFDLLDPLEYGSSYLPLQLPLLWSLPPSLPVLSEWAPHGTMLDLGPCTLACICPMPWIPSATPCPAQPLHVKLLSSFKIHLRCLHLLICFFS